MKNKLLVLFFFLFFIRLSFCQETVTLFLDRGMPKDQRDAIEEMCGLLKKAVSVNFEKDSVKSFNGSGIYITTTRTDTYRKTPPELKTMGSEAVYIKSNPASLYISGNSSLGLQHGIFLYLNKLGFRFYFPDSAWFIIPSRKSIFITHSQLAAPDFGHRTISMGWGYGNDQLKNKFLFWQRANLMGGEMEMNIGHAYDAMIIENRQEFETHPEWLSKPLVNGKKQTGTVLNYSAPGLTDLAHRWLMKRFATAAQKNLKLDMQSLEPFDGPNFCNLPSCLRIGNTASDQVFYFTNEVAKKLKKTNLGKKIGMFAYYDHIDIPKFKLEDNIFIAITNGYNTTHYSTDELIERWKTKTETLAIYDYLAVYAGASADLPVKSPQSNYKSIAERIKRFKRAGIIGYKAESIYGWVNKGPGHYVAARISFDTKQDEEAIITEFFNLCFPQTNTIIRPIYSNWDNTYIITDNDMYNWMSGLKKAFTICDNAAELERLNQLALYLYYTQLYREYIAATGEEKREKGTKLLAYLWDIMPEGVIASFAALNTLPYKFGSDYLINNKNAPWKNQKPVYPHNKKEWISYMDGFLPGLQRMQLDKAYSYTATEAITEKAVNRKFSWVNPKRSITFSGNITAVIETTRSPKDSLFIKMRGGTYKKSGKIGIKLFTWNNELTASGKPLKEFYFPADGKQYQVSLATFPKGKYIVSFTDDGTLGEIYFSESAKFSIVASQQAPLLGGSSNNLYFYVPEGTKRFYIIKSHLLLIYNAKNQLKKFPETDRQLEINVEKGEEGWWRVQIQREQLMLIGIPPFVSRDPDSFLFP